MATKSSSKTSLTFFTTGTVQIKMAMYTQPADRSILRRRLNLFTSNKWTDPLPVGVFLVSHPSGPFLFDTGESPCCNDPGFFPAWNVPIRTLSRAHIKPEDSIVHQLKNHGIEPENLKGIVLSHLHRDHAGGLEEIVKEAPDVPVYVSREHWDAFGNSYYTASINGCAPGHWPPNFSPRLLEPKDHPVGPWKQTYPLTTDGRVVAVDTPGHVPGHVSLVVRGENEDGSDTIFFLTGDATYGMEILEEEQVDGVNDDPLRARESVRLIKEFARGEEVVVLPSHDTETPKMLKERKVYRPKDKKGGKL